MKALRITITIVWSILGLWLFIPIDDGRQLGDMWMEGGDLLVKTQEVHWYDGLGPFLLFMIPIIGMWLWELFKEDSNGKPQKRRSRMF